MKDLKCGQKNCKHNQGYCCCAKQICVDCHSDCVSYEHDTKNKNMFEAGKEFTPANYSVDTKVACAASCIFNKDNICIAGGITVMSEENNEATCVSFVPRAK